MDPIVPAVAVLAVLLVSVAAACLLRRDRRAPQSRPRLEILPYRTDEPAAADLIGVYETLHRRLLAPWPRRSSAPRASIALEWHVSVGARGAPRAAAALTCPAGALAGVTAALRSAYPNVRLRPTSLAPAEPSRVLTLGKRRSFVERLPEPAADDERRALADRALAALVAAGGGGFVQLVLVPAPERVNRLARRLHDAREARTGAHAAGQPRPRPRPDEALFRAELRVGASTDAGARLVAAELCTDSAGNRLVVRRLRSTRRTAARVRRIERGEPGPLLHARRRDVFAATELAWLWQLPSAGFAAAPLVRSAIPFAPAAPAICRPAGPGLLRDAHGGVSIEPALRAQNTAVSGAVGQGKTSYITGNLTHDPELRSTKSDQSVCLLRVACSTRRRKADGSGWEDKPNYFDVNVWGAQGTNAHRYLRRGRPVAIDGRLEWREWEDPSGKKRHDVTIVADTVQFLGAPAAAADAQAATPDSGSSAPAAAAQPGRADGEPAGVVLGDGAAEAREPVETF